MAQTEAQAKYYKANKDKINARHKKRGVSNPEQRILTHAKSRSKKQGITFDITIEDIKIPKECPILGIALVLDNTRLQDNSPSLDKFNPNLGYVKGNVNVISNRANVMKSNATTSEVGKLHEWMLSKESI